MIGMVDDTSHEHDEVARTAIDDMRETIADRDIAMAFYQQVTAKMENAMQEMAA